MCGYSQRDEPRFRVDKTETTNTFSVRLFAVCVPVVMASCDAPAVPSCNQIDSCTYKSISD